MLAAMRLRQRAAHLLKQPRRVLRCQAAHAIEAPIEGLAREELHHDERPPVLHHPVVKDFHHVPALECGGGACLVLEAGARFGAVQVLGLDELDRDAGSERGMNALPDRAHAAMAEQPR